MLSDYNQTVCFLPEILRLSTGSYTNIYSHSYALFTFSVAFAYAMKFLGNSGGPAFNDQGECIGVAFQVCHYKMFW